MVHSMMTRAPLSIYFGGYALETSAHILNLVPSKKVEKTSHEMWTGKKPSLAHIKVWGCEVCIRHESQDKLAYKSEKYLFVGYPLKSYVTCFIDPLKMWCFQLEEDFFEKENLQLKKSVGATLILKKIQESSNEVPNIGTSTQPEVEIPVEPVDESLPLRRSTRVRHPPEFYGLHITTEKGYVNK